MPQKNLFKEEKEIKLPNEKGFLLLDRVKIRYKFNKEEFGSPHLEFTSVEDSKPNLISDTGYRSWFVNWDLTDISSVQQLIKMYLEAELKGKPNYTLEFETEKQEVEVDDDSDWNEIHNLETRCKDKEEFAYLFVEYNANPTLESKNEHLSMSSTHEMPKGQLGSSYGSWGWTYGKDKTIEKLFEELVDFMKSNADKPFHPTLKGIATTTLNLDNVIITI
ncbi:MAG TPA: hypothetical protein VMZ91_10225, partial [Candidatus Paceibacterota bacterium]|nr:hypothetical protein [Candidatus Paceibacterota bacterium]